MESQPEVVGTTTTTTNNNYFKHRLEDLRALQESQQLELYPHKFPVSCEISCFREKYDSLEKGDMTSCSDVVSVAGRIEGKRDASTKLVFIDILNQGCHLQVMANMAHYGEADAFKKDIGHLRRGDVIGIVGRPGKTKTGELSIMATSVKLLAPCFHNLPFNGTLTEMETRHRNRHLDMIVNPGQADIYRKRAKIIKFIRGFFDERGYVEVETPMMNVIPGGANARPFVTHHNDLHTNMFLRIAPELFLKQCVIGGLNRVYEIGKNFRNEGIDLTHNPEYTAIETYCAYDDFFDVMKTTEDLLSSMVLEITGSYKVSYILKNGKEAVIDFSPPFKRVPLIATLEELLGREFPKVIDSEEMHCFLVELLKEKRLECQPLTIPKMLDTLVGEFIEPDLINPSFITEHPQIMSPLAKWHRSKKGLTERFELFVAGRELCNAYTELNDPFVQRETFLSEQKGRNAGDDEAQPVDEGFCESLEYGLPPTAGWGMGIDRLVMILTGQTSIKEVILFPTMKPLERERQAQKQISFNAISC